jgi:hypothetical protein
VSGVITYESCGYTEPWYQDTLAIRLLIADERHLQPTGFVPGVLRFIDKEQLQDEPNVHAHLRANN